MFQFCVVRRHEWENTIYCALSLLIQNKIRAFQIEGRVQHGRCVRGGVTGVQGAVGWWEALQEQWVMCSWCHCHTKVVSRNLEWWDWSGKQAAWLPTEQQIHGVLKWRGSGSDFYFIKTTTLCGRAFWLISSIEDYGHDTVSHEFT